MVQTFKSDACGIPSWLSSEYTTKCGGCGPRVVGAGFLEAGAADTAGTESTEKIIRAEKIYRRLAFRGVRPIVWVIIVVDVKEVPSRGILRT